MILTSLPNAKFVETQRPLTIGKDYEVIKTVGNCYVIQSDKDDTLLVLQTRFEVTSETTRKTS